MSIGNKYYDDAHSKKRIAPFLLFFVLLLFRFAHAYGMRIPQTLIEPTADVELFYGQPVRLQVRISDPSGILMVRCYFRYQSPASLFFVELKVGEDGLYHGSLPAPGSMVKEIEFQYVVINASRQVIRSPLYSADLQIGTRRSFPVNSEVPTCLIRTELAAAVQGKGEGRFFNPEHVKIEIVAKEERYGLVAGLYTPEDLSGIGIVEGYFGGFILQEDGCPLPVKGIMLNSGPVSTADSYGNKPATTSVSTPPAPKIGADLIGPDIEGEDWHGLCYYGWGESLGFLLVYDPTPVVAHVTHEGSTMAITLSTVCYITGEKIGPYLSGSIDSYGNVLVLDQRIPPQTWSSHWGPVTATKILIGDYVTLPTPDNPYADYYVIELERDPPPPVRASLPAVYNLLL